MIDEREHRRGLILGLTLAEVLLLLLFVLLLALASRFKELKRDRDDLRVAIKEMERPIEPSIARPETTGSIIKPEVIPSVPSVTNDNKGEAVKVEDGLSPKPLPTLDIYPDAARIDPNDPPQVLKLVREFLKVGVNADRLAALTEMAGVKAELTPGASSKEVLARTIQILEQLKTPAGKVPPETPEDTGWASTVKEIDNVGQKHNPAPITTSSEGSENHVASEGATGKHNWPPIITLSEADGRFFQSGSAELSPELRETIVMKVIPRLLDTVAKYDVNVVEVIGHTDEQPIASRASDLDKTLPLYVRGVPEVKSVQPSDNAGLGLARAATVARLLVETGALSNVRILPFSGGQLINVDDTLTSAQATGVQEQRRRRIEIRVRRTDKQVEPQAIAPKLVRREVIAPPKAIDHKAEQKKEVARPPKAVKQQEKGFLEKLFDL